MNYGVLRHKKSKRFCVPSKVHRRHAKCTFCVLSVDPGNIFLEIFHFAFCGRNCVGGPKSIDKGCLSNRNEKKSLFRGKSRNETEISSHGCHSRTIYDRPHTPLVLWSTMTTTTTTTSTTTMATTKPNNASFDLPGAKQMAAPKPRPNISKQA